MFNDIRLHEGGFLEKLSILFSWLIDGRDYISPKKAIYTWYISGITGRLPTTYHLLQESENPLIMGGYHFWGIADIQNDHEVPRWMQFADLILPQEFHAS